MLDAIFATYDKIRSELSRSRDKESRLLNVAVDILNAVNDIRVLGSNRPDIAELKKGDGTVGASSTWREDEFFKAAGAFMKTDRYQNSVQCLLSNNE